METWGSLARKPKQMVIARTMPDLVLKTKVGAREISQHVIGFAALPVDQVWLPKLVLGSLQLYKLYAYNSNSRHSDTVFLLPRAPHTFDI